MKKVVLILMVLFLSSLPLFASDKNILTDPLESIEMATPTNWDSNNPVWLSGKIYGIDDTSITIDDVSYRVGNKIEYYLSSGEKSTGSSFRKDLKVKFVLAPGKRDTIIKLIK
jgi:hypothetical protein